MTTYESGPGHDGPAPEPIQEETAPVLLPERYVQQFPTVSDYIDFVEKRDELLRRTLPIALASTAPQDWVSFGSGPEARPWPRVGGCDKIMRRFAIKATGFHFTKTESVDEEGRLYIYTCFGTFALPGGLDIIQAVGTCSSRKPFFGIKGGEIKRLKDIREDDVKKAARSNCVTNGIMEILGFKGLTWEELEATKPGFTRKDCASVQFKEGGKKTAPSRKTNPASAQRPAPQQKPPAPKPEPIPQADPARVLRAVSEFSALADYLVATGQAATPDEVCQRYLSDETGSQFIAFNKLPALKTQRAIDYLFKKITEAVQTENFEEWARWISETGCDSTLDPSKILAEGGA